MTAYEASMVETRNYLRTTLCKSVYEETMFELAIEAIEKQISKEPIDHRCHNCMHYIGAIYLDKEFRCRICGQLLFKRD